ncbi:peptidoglycan DD-metalloendopeptidase family protein [Propionibacteriaceae bacterium Y1685]|uniref:peptidoglycan DD-metalloendopeptidase family protein n=1 Tax=Microlunatus sp. Y1700 TaxID=3418487 RepID=UPI003B811A04
MKPRVRRVVALAVSVLALVMSVLLIGTVLTPAAARATPPLPQPSGWPLTPAPEVVRGFEPPKEKWGAGNRGLDLAADDGQQVLAAGAGRVSFAGTIAGRGVVVIDHGGVRTTYEPVSASVSVGARVAYGDVIGVVRGSHCADRGCLHWGLRQGEEYLDPLLLINTTTPPGPTSPVRLLPGDAVKGVLDRIAARKAAAGVGGVGIGPGGEHGFVLPAAGPITSAFGMRTHPVTGVHKLHDGMDVGAACGSPLRAPADGVIEVREFNSALGNRVVIDHGVVDGYRVRTSLNHAQSLAVSAGDRVTRGQVVGLVGSTGLSTGCHLHLMVWLNGQLVDPATWF